MARWKRGQWHKTNRNANILEGIPSIAEFLGKSYETTRRWIFHKGLPAAKMPNGVWFTHKGLILQWIYASGQAQLKERVQYSLEPDAIQTLAEKMQIEPELLEEKLNEQRREDARNSSDRSAV
jgi:hypothetical protein